jgi:hypothetical protein
MQQAMDELQAFDLGAFEIPDEIQLAETESYVCICIKSKDNQEGTAKIHSSRLCYANTDKWAQMNGEIKAKRSKGLFAGLFNKVVILHNPTLPNTFGMDWQENQVNELLDRGKDAAFIAQNLGVMQSDVEKFLKAKQPKGLSPTQKGQVNKMLENGTAKDAEGVAAIAKELNIELDRIKAYVDSL